MHSTTGMKISELGRRANVGPKTIRYYEARGLLPEPKRFANGYRAYSEDDVHRLEFIRAAQAAGLSLRGVSDLLNVIDEGRSPCQLAQALARDHIAEIDRQIRTLECVRRRLASLLEFDETDQPKDAAEVMCQLIGV